LDDIKGTILANYRHIILIAIVLSALAAYALPVDTYNFANGGYDATASASSNGGYDTSSDSLLSNPSPTLLSNPPPASLLTDIAACQGSGICQIIIRDIYQRPFALIIPEYILQLRPELCLDVNINDVANEIQAIPGVTLIHVYDLPGYQAVSFRGNPGPELLSDQRFVDYNATQADSNAELDKSSGHAAQVRELDSDAALLTASQSLPTGLKRTILDPAIANNTFIYTAQNVTTTNATLINATSLAPACEMQRITPISTDANMSASDFNVDVAVLDTGVSLDHPDLNVYRDVTFLNGTTTGNDDNGHGSHVAGIAAAKDNDVGIVGVAPGARIWAIKVCDASGECKITNQMKGIEYAIKHADEIDVLNISIENPNSPALNSIIDEAVKAGITVVVAAGNYGKDASLTSPANNPNVITVSAIGDSDGVCGAAGPDLVLAGDNATVTDDSFAFFSNFGPVVKIAAPGVNILSTYNGTGYAVDSGTSMAAPYVTGAAAIYKAQHPYAVPSEVMSAILGSGSKPDTSCNGAAHGYFTGDLDTLPEPLLYREPVPPSTNSPSPITPSPIPVTSRPAS
jgi:subtilisin family serine protease